MTKIKHIMTILKFLRATVQTLVCYDLGIICMKLNGNDTPPRILHRGVKRGMKDIADAANAFEFDEDYEK